MSQETDKELALDEKPLIPFRRHFTDEELLGIMAELGQPERGALKCLSRDQKMILACELFFHGVSMSQAAEALDISKGTISKWFSNEPELMTRYMKQALSRDALMTLPESWEKLKAMRDCENYESARKSILDCLRAAGCGIDLGAQVATTIIHAQGKNVQVNMLTVRELDERIEKLAKQMNDPDVKALVDAEVKEEDRDARTTQAPAARP